MPLHPDRGGPDLPTWQRDGLEDFSLKRKRRLRVSGDETGRLFVGGASFVDPKRGISSGVSSMLTEIDLGDLRLRKLNHFLTVAEDNAVDYCAGLTETKSPAMQKAFLDCGSHRLKVADDLRQIIEELAKSAKITKRELDLARRWNREGLLSKAGLAAVEAAK